MDVPMLTGGLLCDPPETGEEKSDPFNIVTNQWLNIAI
jgi:hypothetical protein